MEQAKPSAFKTAREARDNFRNDGPAHELGLWLRALGSFFQVQNHPTANTDQVEVLSRDWASETRIVRRVLLRSTQLSYSLLSLCGTQEDALFDVEGAAAAIAPALPSPETFHSEALADASDRSYMKLGEALKDTLAACDSLLENGAVNLHAWASLGKTLTRQLEHLEAAKAVMRTEHHYSTANLQDSLVALTRSAGVPESFGPDLLIIFTELARLLRRLEFIESLLKRDQPLKQTLPIFALVYEGTRWLMQFIEACLARAEGLDQAVLDELDVTNYAMVMELRRVYSQELVGLTALRQAPAIFARIETAHGLLNNCFQQSTTGLAQLFDPALDGARLFDTFQTKLEQSMSLRRDLWLLLQLVQRAERERDQHPVSQLVARLGAFRNGSMRYLMYKDWEACERFIEEVSAARGAIELTPVLHRFGAYLETLFNQVNMRSVLAGHTFDYPTLEN
ncbi:MAG TPA: hypothetical protein VGX92_06110 [Pyrinomonadaceae bacterium]|jgi:hypothetical protein|nr:hypothetical protein [Pyrinomonadaceae bacterium]